MSEMIVKSFASHRVHTALDWGVFSAGALALAIALGATIVSKTNLVSAELPAVEASTHQAI